MENVQRQKKQSYSLVSPVWVDRLHLAGYLLDTGVPSPLVTSYSASSLSVMGNNSHVPGAVLCSWEGNCRSCVAAAARGISNYGLNGLRKDDEHPAYSPV